MFDADALIKLTKAKIPLSIKKNCIISEEVYEETVVEGKKYEYEDAYAIEELIIQEKIKIHKAEKIKNKYNFGKGELSTLSLFLELHADAIVTDDRKFITLLEMMNIPFIITTEFIVGLVLSSQLEKREGIEALNRIKSYIRKENYEFAIKCLEEKK